MKDGIVYILNKNFLKYWKVSIYSLCAHTVLKNIDVILYVTDDIVKEVTSFCSLLNLKNLRLYKINPSKYNDIKFNSQREWGLNPAIRFEIFNLKKYSKILYLDCDTIIVKSISDIFKHKTRKLSVCKLHPLTNLHYFKNNFQGFNAGVMLIPNNLLTRQNYNKLIDMCKTNVYFGNQEPLNLLFKTKTTFLPQSFNVTTDLLTLDNIKTAYIIHFIGAEKYNFKTNKIEYSDYVNRFINKMAAFKLNLQYIDVVNKVYELEKNV